MATASQHSIICIHDLGGSPKTTWHHDESGKTWISDPDFLGSLKDSVRVWTYGYNSEPVANMTPASIALHADELLASMMEEYSKYSVCLNRTCYFVLSTHILDPRADLLSLLPMGSEEP
ncbi:hypothetical protein ColLi_12912 [Colletotrichum liriopes]|uniref:Uncharacterized protein n=1 Tax=Colletotrichum liriopes TaxID=708192 RepID=A0AA37GZ85_9PEZI|nr:hypothetical protein ColLi_12912 [Colletotrichum liriopes]